MSDDHLHVVFACAEGVNAEALVSELVEASLEDLQDPPDLTDALRDWFVVEWVGTVAEHSVVRLVLDLGKVTPDPDERAPFVEAFIERIVSDTDRITECARFHDCRIRNSNLELAEELFALEMALREALTLMILGAGSTVTETLDQSTVRPKNPPSGADLRKPHAESELFYLLFSEYVQVNSINPVANMTSVIAAIAAHETFDQFKQFMLRTAVHDDDALESFLASLKALMDPVEKVRNAVAHNRVVRDRLRQDYSRAKAQLDTNLTEVLKAFE